MSSPQTLALRLAGPLQAWGFTSQFNRRDTQDRPTKAGVIGLLAAAQGRHRGGDLTDLLELRLAVRADQPGSLLRDYHTVSDFTGEPLLSAATNAKGAQKRTSPKKFTHVTQRYYLQDAVFLAMVRGETELMASLAEAVTHPRYPLSLGRRSCPPSQPLIIEAPDGLLWSGELDALLRLIPWQGGVAARSVRELQASVLVAATLDDSDGDDEEVDVPRSFDPLKRGYTARRVRHLWVSLPTGATPSKNRGHDPFVLLGG